MRMDDLRRPGGLPSQEPRRMASLRRHQRGARAAGGPPSVGHPVQRGRGPARPHAQAPLGRVRLLGDCRQSGVVQAGPRALRGRAPLRGRSRRVGARGAEPVPRRGARQLRLGAGGLGEPQGRGATGRWPAAGSRGGRPRLARRLAGRLTPSGTITPRTEDYSAGGSESAANSTPISSATPRSRFTRSMRAEAARRESAALAVSAAASALPAAARVERAASRTARGSGSAGSEGVHPGFASRYSSRPKISWSSVSSSSSISSTEPNAISSAAATGASARDADSSPDWPPHASAQIAARAHQRLGDGPLEVGIAIDRSGLRRPLQGFEDLALLVPATAGGRIVDLDPVLSEAAVLLEPAQGADRHAQQARRSADPQEYGLLAFVLGHREFLSSEARGPGCSIPVGS